MWKLSQERGKDLPVAFVMGVCPPVLLAAATSTDFGTDEMRIASSLKESTVGGPLEVYKLKSGLIVPAQAEVVMEGRITSKMEDEGPFLDITGTYIRYAQHRYSRSIGSICGRTRYSICSCRD